MFKLLKIGVLVLVAGALAGVSSAQAQSKMQVPGGGHNHNGGFYGNPNNPYNPYSPFNPLNPLSPYNPVNPYGVFNSPYYNPTFFYTNPYAPFAYNPSYQWNPYSIYNPFTAAALSPFVLNQPGAIHRAVAYQNTLALANTYYNAAYYNTLAYNNAVANNTASYYNTLAANNAAMYNNAQATYNNAVANSNAAAMYNMYASAANAANNTAALNNAIASYNSLVNNPYGPSSAPPARYSTPFSGGPSYNPYGSPGVVPFYAPSRSAPPSPGPIDGAPMIPKRTGPDIYGAVNAPNIVQEEVRTKYENLKKFQLFATTGDITSGAALNALVDDLRTSLGKPFKAADITVSEDVLRKINVTGDPKHGSLGILRDDGKIVWPGAFANADVLTPDEKKRMEDTAQKAVLKAYRDQIDPDLLRALRTQINTARDRLARKVNQIRTMDYIDAKRFLGDLDDSCKAIEKNEAPVQARFEKLAVGGKSVKEVADYMIKNGLKFAPATSLDESAYRALHSALVALDIAYNSQFPDH